MSLRQRLARALLVAMVIFSAALSVGLTSPADGPFAVSVRPVFLQMDPASIAESRARALGLDVDVKVGSMHLHLGWSAIPLVTASTPRTAEPL